MARIVLGIMKLPDETPDICRQCNKFGPTKPYGPNNTPICYECAIKDSDRVYELVSKLVEEKVDEMLQAMDYEEEEKPN
jgi:hypothetical protein